MLSMKNVARKCARRARRGKRTLASCASLALVAATPVTVPLTHVPAGTTEYVTQVTEWVGGPTSTDMMFETLEANGYSTTGIAGMGHETSQCGNFNVTVVGCAIFTPSGIEIIMDISYVGTYTGLFILMHEYRHATVDLTSPTLTVDECNADRFAEAVVPGVQGAFGMCDTHGIPFEGADFHEPINFVVQ